MLKLCYHYNITRYLHGNKKIFKRLLHTTVEKNMDTGARSAF